MLFAAPNFLFGLLLSSPPPPSQLVSIYASEGQ